jgi:hypothetical protein
LLGLSKPTTLLLLAAARGVIGSEPVEALEVIGHQPEHLAAAHRLKANYF